MMVQGRCSGAHCCRRLSCWDCYCIVGAQEFWSRDKWLRIPGASECGDVVRSAQSCLNDYDRMHRVFEGLW